jgi:hypothetical protein
MTYNILGETKFDAKKFFFLKKKLRGIKKQKLHMQFFDKQDFILFLKKYICNLLAF